MQEWDKDKFIAAAQQEYRLGAEEVAEFDKHIYLAMKRLYSRYRSRDCGQLQDSRRSLVPTHRPVLREECAMRNRHCKTAPRVEATHPDCGIFSLAERDQEVGQRICSTISKRTDHQRHRQSGVYESGPRDPPQRDGNASRRGQKLSPTTWKVRSLLSSETTHLALHKWTSEKIAPGQTPAPGLGSSSQSTTSSSHGGSDRKFRWCVVRYAARQKGKVEVSTASATTVESQVIRPSSFMQKVDKQKERERRETAKVGVTVKVGQPERDGLKVKVGTRQVKVGNNNQ